MFAKAISGRQWPSGIDAYRTEGRITAASPTTVPAPRLLGSGDDGDWFVLVFEDVDGHQPTQRWRQAELDRVLAVLDDVPAPIDLPRDHPRRARRR